MWKYAIDSCRKIHLAKFPNTTEFIADTSPKDSPADLRCALHLLLFGHLYSVLTRCDPLISLHFSPLQRKESTLFLLESSLFWLSETKTNNQYMFISFLIFFSLYFLIQVSHLEMHEAPQTLDLSFPDNNVGQGCIYRAPRHILLR